MSYELGIVIPVYRSKKSVKRLVEELRRIFLPQVKIRICLVDDSGDTGISEYLKENCMAPEVKLLTLDQNYGQQAAVLCGLEHMAPCRFYATIDDDMEQPPAMIERLYREALKGYDLVYGIPIQNRGRPVLRRLGSRLRDFLFSRILGVPGDIKVSSLRVITREALRPALRYRHRGFFYLSAAVFLSARRDGRLLKVKDLYYNPGKPRQGGSGYGILDLIKLYGKLFWHYGMCRPDTMACLNIHFLHGKYKGKDVYRIKKVEKPDRLMVLGGSNCQIHALARAREMGLDTVLIDYTDSPPAAALAGVHVKASTFDAEACVRAAREYHVTGVMTMGTDQPVFTAAKVCHTCGLPAFLSVEQGFSVTNKKRMKEILSRNGISTARYRIVDESTKAEDLVGMKAPLVIKPLDSQGQRGIFKAGSAREALDHLQDTLSYSRQKEALVEEFYESGEVTVSGWIQHGRLHILTVTDRLLYPDDIHIGVCIGHRFPTAYMDMYQEIAEISAGVAAAFQIENGPFYLQLLIGEDGIKVNELAARIGGAFEDVFIPWITGFDILQAVLDSAMGGKVDTKGLEDWRADQTDRCAAVQLLFCRPGRIGFVTPLDELRQQPYILDAGYNYSAEQCVPPMENATARFGHAVICGTRKNIGERVADFYRRLSVRSEDGREMMERFYPVCGGNGRKDIIA